LWSGYAKLREAKAQPNRSWNSKDFASQNTFCCPLSKQKKISHCKQQNRIEAFGWVWLQESSNLKTASENKGCL